MTKLINILMQRNDCNVPWGFDIQERQHLQQPLIINRVLQKAVAAHNITVGDVILQIQGKNVTTINNTEIRQILKIPTNELHLIILQNKNPKIQHNPPLTLIKPVSNAIPQRQPKPEPIFNKPVYKPIVPKVPLKPNDYTNNIYKPKVPMGYQRPQTPSRKIIHDFVNNRPNNSKELRPKTPPKKVLRDFVNNESTQVAAPKLYNFITQNNQCEYNSLLDKKKNYFEQINTENERKTEYGDRPKKKVQDIFLKSTNDKKGSKQFEFSLPTDFYKSNNRRSVMETPNVKNQWNQIKYSTKNYKENEKEIGNSVLTNETYKKENNIPYEYKNVKVTQNIKDKNLRNLGRCFSDMNIFSNSYKKPYMPSFQKIPKIDKKVYDYIQNRCGDQKNKSKCDLIMTEYMSSEDDTNSTTTEIYRDFSSEEVSLLESTKDDDDSLYMYEVLNEKTVDKTIEFNDHEYQPNQIVIKSETLTSFPSSTKSTYSKINNLSCQPFNKYYPSIEKSSTQVITPKKPSSTKIQYQHPYGQSLKMKEKYFEKYLQDALADNEEIISANLISYREVESRSSQPNGKDKGHLFKNDICIEIQPTKFSFSDSSTVDDSYECQSGYCGSEYSFDPDSDYYDPYSRQQSTPTSDYGPPQGDLGYQGAPPPPPPPGPGHMPSKRLSTEIPDRRLEPPACVQNAMMTKDKKPFTYTPGGLDLSQIKSPRMARRVSRNAHAEGVTDVPKLSPLAQQPGQLPPAALAAMQPQLPVAVFPSGAIPPPPPPPSNQSPVPPPPPMQNNTNKPVQENNKSPTFYQRPDIKSIIPPNPTAMLRPTGGPHRREVDDDAGRVAKPQLGTLYIPPVSQSDEFKSPPQRNIQSPPNKQVESPVLNKAPTPWLTQRQQQTQQTPPWAHVEQQSFPSPVTPKATPVFQERRVSDPDTVDNSKKAGPGIQFQHRPQQVFVQPQQPYMPQQQQAYVPQQQVYMPQQQQQQQQVFVQQQQVPKGTRIIPIQMESSINNQPTPGGVNNTNSSRIENDPRRRWNANGNTPMSPPEVQFAKMQLQDEDQNLMNKFRNQVDEDTYLHNETDPRYRGAAIPSRAFRMLQTMTDTSNTPDMPAQTSTGPRGPVVRTIPIQRAYQDDNSNQQYIPPSEQQVAEPRKYTGSAIPSRSFRMLQAMTAPNNNPACGPDESDL